MLLYALPLGLRLNDLGGKAHKARFLILTQFGSLAMIINNNNSSLSGFDRMIEDANRAAEPIFEFFKPFASFLHSVGLYLAAGVFVLLMAYLIFVRKHTVKKKLCNKKNYIFIFVMLALYVVLSVLSSFNTYIDINLNIVAITMVAKQLGPVISGVFGLLQYFAALIVTDVNISVASMLVAGISGMIYAIFIYDKKTSYINCLKAKLMVNIVCNIILVPATAPADALGTVSSGMLNRIVSNIFLAPVQALIMFAGLVLLKKYKKNLEQKDNSSKKSH